MNGLSTALTGLHSAGWRAIELERPWLLLLLLLVGAALGIALVVENKRPTLRIAGVEGAAAATRSMVRIASLVCAFFAAVFCVAAISGPFVKGEPDPASSEGIDIVIALDISTSMRAADFRPKDRLFVAKEVIRDHVLSRSRDRVGLVIFAGEAFTQAPLTHDKALLKEVLEGIKMGIIVDGTAIGDGLALALSRLESSKAKTRVVMLLTDGDNNAGQLAPETSMAMAKELGVKVFTILVGKSGKVPYPDGVDMFGAPRYRTVEMPVNPALLKQIAKETGGSYFQATDKKSLETSLQTILEALDKSQLAGAPPVRQRIPLGGLLLLPALLLACTAGILRFTKGSIVP